jgi:hypothetical protein
VSKFAIGLHFCNADEGNPICTHVDGFIYSDRNIEGRAFRHYSSVTSKK